MHLLIIRPCYLPSLIINKGDGGVMSLHIPCTIESSKLPEVKYSVVMESIDRITRKF